MKRLLLFFLFNILFSSIICQINIDSLWNIWDNNKQSDENRLSAINKIIRHSIFSNPDSAFIYAQWQLDFAVSIDDKIHIAKAYNMQGISCHIRSEYDNSIKYLLKSIEIYEEMDDLENLAAPLGNLGIIYQDKGDLKNSIKYFNKSLSIYEKVKDDNGVAASLNNIGTIYESLGNTDKAIEYYNRSLSYYENIVDKYGIASNLNNIGIIYIEKNELLKAEKTINKSLFYYKEIQDKQGVGNSLNGLGKIHQIQGDYKLAISVLNEALKIQTEIGDKEGAAKTLTEISITYELLKDHKNAISYGKKAISIALEIGNSKEIKDAAESLYNSYKSIGKHENALEKLELYISTLKSIQNEENKKEIIRQEFKYNYEKKEAVANAEHEAAMQQQEAAALAEKKQQNIIISAVSTGLTLVALFLLFVFNRLRITKRQKHLIENQHDKLEETHLELTDSINYAKRIQAAVLPSDKTFKSYLEDSFIIYIPKDIVAGDFYWIEEKNDNILFAAADCTGHGVPGAMVSVFGNNALNRSVREFGLTDPSKILEKSREIIISEFEKSDDEVKDGMDIALCSLKNNKLKYSGAYNPLWIVRNNELIEYKGDNQPIGRFRDSAPFNTREIDLVKGDTIYIFSDGFSDQFGGERGKKFKLTNFKKLILSLNNKPLDLQKKLLLDSFYSWKGELEQIDDVCVMGVRI